MLHVSDTSVYERCSVRLRCLYVVVVPKSHDSRDRTSARLLAFDPQVAVIRRALRVSVHRSRVGSPWLRPLSRSELLVTHLQSSPNRASPSRRAPLLREECSEVWLPGLCCFVAATSDGDGPGSAQLCLAAMHALSARLCCFADLSTIDCSVGLG